MEDIDKIVAENSKLAYYHGREDAKAYYCFEGKYEGKAPFVFGTALLPLNASQEEILEEGKRKWQKVFPFDPPPVFYPVKGIIIFNKAEDN